MQGEVGKISVYFLSHQSHHVLSIADYADLN